MTAGNTFIGTQPPEHRFRVGAPDMGSLDSEDALSARGRVPRLLPKLLGYGVVPESLSPSIRTPTVPATIHV